MSDETAARMPLTLDGVTYLMSPLTDRDIIELDRWVQAQCINVTRQNLELFPPKTQAEREELLSIAMKTAMTLTWMSGVGARMVSTLDGAVQLVWQSIHHAHPNVTVDDIKGKLIKKGNIAAFNAQFRLLNNLRGEKRGPQPTPDATQSSEPKSTES